MTSPANQQNTSAPNPTPSTSSASYASAAGAPKKSTATTPVIATGSNPVVVGSTPTPTQQHAGAPPSPMNGKPQVAAPVPATIVRGSLAANGSVGDHGRKDSVTMAPGSFAGTNGGLVGGSKATMPQFGSFQDNSPSVSNSTLQQVPSAAVAVPSPAHSPSPIPRASGGRPPSTIPQDGSSMKFGSLGGDGDRHMKHLSNLSQNSVSLGAQPTHARHDSTHSLHTDMGHHVGQGPNRGGYQPQGGRARGGFNSAAQFAGQSMGFPPSGQYPRGPAGQGRGSMPNQFPQRGAMPQYSSPQPARASPNMAAAMPNSGAPHAIQPPMPVAGGQAGPYQQFQYPPPGGYPPNVSLNNFAYSYDPRSVMQPPFPYPQLQQYMGSPSPSPAPAFPANYPGGQFNPPPQSMSRSTSQVSGDRPNSSTGQAQPPVIVQSGTPQPSVAQPKAPAVVASGTFQKAKKSVVSIKNAQGEPVTFNSLKTPASPVPSIPPSKTPPVIASTPTPPPKPSTPSHSRSDSTAAVASKTAEQLRNEFKEQVRKTAEGPADQKGNDEAPGTPLAEDEGKDAAFETAEVAKAAETPTGSASAVEGAAPEEAEACPSPDITSQDQPGMPPQADTKNDEDEMERAIRELEELDAKREAQQAEYTAQKKVRDEEAKKSEEALRLVDAAENDRKLKEAERQMELLEEERDRKRAEGGDKMTIKEALDKKIDDLIETSEKPTVTPSPLDSVTTKLGELKVTDVEAGPAGKPSTEKQRTKPSALNLAPLNTKAVEPPQPSAALQSLKTARFIGTHEKIDYPAGINSPNPALNTAVTKKGNFKYDTGFLLQFKNVFTEKPSVDFDQQVKALIGDGESGSRSAVRTPAGAGSGRQNSRTAAPGFPAMGSFGAKPLPPGTTSEQRFAMSSGNMARPNMPAMAAFGRTGAFPGPSQMSRSPSSSNMGMPNSPRQGSRSTRGGSKRDNYNAKTEAQAAKTMPLTQGQEVRALATSNGGWKASSIASKAGPIPAAINPASGLLDPPMVQRKVKAALNKMTPEKFDRISDQILTIALQSKDEEDGRTLRQVIQLTFEKATDEAHWAPMYAKFCKRMLDMMSPEIRDTTILDKNGNVVSGGALFRKYLLNRCQEEFERGWKTDLPKPKDGETKEAIMLSDEYYEAAAAKRRGLGLVQFIGELYKLGMLTERIMHECVRKLVDYQGTPDEAEIESLSKLLRTIGANLDNTEKGKPMMDAYFARIQNIIELPDLPSRLKFMLMDVVDMRRNNWRSSEANKGPKTLEEVRQDAEAAALQKAAEATRSSQRGPAGGRPPIGRGDARQFSGYNQPAPNQVGMDDLRRLKGSATRTASSNVTLGPQSMFASRSNSGRRLGPGGSLGRAGEESGTSSRTGTPPTREAASHSNAFHILASMETENPASPPSTAASPALAKAVPDSSSATGGKKEPSD